VSVVVGRGKALNGCTFGPPYTCTWPPLTHQTKSHKSDTHTTTTNTTAVRSPSLRLKPAPTSTPTPAPSIRPHWTSCSSASAQRSPNARPAPARTWRPSTPPTAAAGGGAAAAAARRAAGGGAGGGPGGEGARGCGRTRPEFKSGCCLTPQMHLSGGSTSPGWRATAIGAWTSVEGEGSGSRLVAWRLAARVIMRLCTDRKPNVITQSRHRPSQQLLAGPHGP